MKPVDVATTHTMKFLEANLKPLGFPKLRLLEVGCGNGELACALANCGVTVRAIDISADAVKNARNLGVDALEASIIGYTDELFDVVLFSRSLHHIHPLADAVKAARALLRANGLLVLEDFAAQSADEVATTWIYELKMLLMSGGILKEDAKAVPLEKPLGHWMHHHFNEHKVATGVELLETVAAEFGGVEHDFCPYLYRYLVRDLAVTDYGGKIAQSTLEWECRLIDSGAIPAIGLRVVANNPANGSPS